MSTYYKPPGSTPKELTPEMIEAVYRGSVRTVERAQERLGPEHLGPVGFWQVEDAQGNKLSLTINRRAVGEPLRHTYRWNKDILEGRAVRRIHKLLTKD